MGGGGGGGGKRKRSHFVIIPESFYMYIGVDFRGGRGFFFNWPILSDRKSRVICADKLSSAVLPWYVDSNRVLHVVPTWYFLSQEWWSSKKRRCSWIVETEIYLWLGFSSWYRWKDDAYWSDVCPGTHEHGNWRLYADFLQVMSNHLYNDVLSNSLEYILWSRSRNPLVYLGRQLLGVWKWK